MEKSRRLPLAGLKVIDLCIARAGPTAVRHLADWGADVIKVEPIEDLFGNEDKRHGFDFQNVHRNKRSIMIDLKNPEGYALLMRMVKDADVVVENWRPDVKQRLKLSWEDLSAVNPRIVLGSNSGFGQDGPIAHRGGVDQIVQGMSGVQSVTGEPDRGPMRTGVPIGDLTAGNLLALGIMMALYERNETGQGRWVTTSLLEGLIMMMDFQASRYLIKGEVPKAVGNMHPTRDTTGVYQCSDGWLNLGGGGSARRWLAICKAIGRTEWAEPSHKWCDFHDRVADRVELQKAIGEITRHKPMSHWISAFEERGVPVGPIYNVEQVFADPQIQHLEMAQPVTHPQLGEIRLVGSPLRFPGSERKMHRPTPERGEHTLEILHEMGLQDGDIEALRKAGAVA